MAAVGWASDLIIELREGRTVRFRPRGHSMSPRIESGQLCTVEPVEASALAVGDIVLCEVGRAQYLHLVKAVEGERFQIGNNRGRINGWVAAERIHGRLVKIEP